MAHGPSNTSLGLVRQHFVSHVCTCWSRGALAGRPTRRSRRETRWPWTVEGTEKWLGPGPQSQQDVLMEVGGVRERAPGLL